MRSLRLFGGLAVVASFALAADKQKLPDGPGKATMERVCGQCHGAEIVIGRKMSHDGWSQVVVNMIQRGAQGSDDEFGEIVDYLTNTVSADVAKVNVNKATAKDLQALTFTDKEADAILAYRGEKGEFKSLDDLKKVPGVDAAKIDAQKAKLTF